MPLINCPECSNKISGLASSCPKCGCPRSAWEKRSLKQNSFQRFLLWVLPIIDDDQKRKNIINSTEKISTVPSLKTINGCGQSIYGYLIFPAQENLSVKVTFLTFLFIPIIPTGVYLVKETDYNSYIFLGKLRFGKLLSILTISEIIKFIISIIFSSALMFVVLIAGLGVVSYFYSILKKLF